VADLRHGETVPQQEERSFYADAAGAFGVFLEQTHTECIGGPEEGA